MNGFIGTLYVSICGTSLLTNSTDRETRRFLVDTANCSDEELSNEDRRKIESRMADQVAVLNGSNLHDVRQLSAEFNTILGAYEERIPVGGQDVHILLHTDTFQGRLVAEALCDWLQAKKLNAQIQRVENLTTKSVNAFSDGVSWLIQWCEATLPGYRESKFQIVFNLTGGFKSLQGFMQTLGMIYGDELIYVFETGGELLRIPRLPLQFEESVGQSVRQHLQIFRRLQLSSANVSWSDCQGIPETFLYRVADMVELSPWGKLVWERHRKEIYRESVLAFLSPKIVISSEVSKTIASFSSEEKCTFNERMDDLAEYLESDRKACLKRLDFKQLRGDPLPPSSHECDLWADRGAWRAFGHFERETFVIDRVGPGLH